MAHKNLKSIERIALSILVIFIIGSFVSGYAQKSSRRLKSGDPKLEVTRERINKLPYTIEIDEDSSRMGKVVVLAIGSSTVCRCPEPPVNVLPAYEAAIQRKESDERVKSSNLYFEASIPNIRTNLFIETRSGSIDIQIQTIEKKGGATVGAYHCEVIIKSVRYNDELAQAYRDLAESQQQASLLKDQIAELEKRAALQAKDACNESAESFLTVLEKSNSAEKKDYINEVG